VFLFPAMCLCMFLGCAEDPTPVPTEITFQAVVGDQAFDCSKEYQGVGRDSGTLKPVDLRMYIHNIRLVRDSADSEEVPFTLSKVQDYQDDASGVALLDFEDGKGNCKNGNATMHVKLKGMAPKYRYKSIKFAMGVPENHNHKDPTSAAAPLNVTSMTWNWKAGRIFMSAMGSNDKGVHLVHIGSAGCKGDPELGEDVQCAKPFRPEYTLTGFDPAQQKVVLDWKTIFSGSNVKDQPEGCNEFEGVNYCGCHSRGPDTVCSPPFTNFGMSWSDGQITSNNQKVFRVENLAPE
ncbi:MAG: MbnP family copper-binding protein, partial [Myxococcota bacterium]